MATSKLPLKPKTKAINFASTNNGIISKIGNVCTLMVEIVGNSTTASSPNVVVFRVDSEYCPDANRVCHGYGSNETLFAFGLHTSGKMYAASTIPDGMKVHIQCTWTTA